ncbi:DEAD/DEAH box helicase [Mangrovibacterium marinum]|uniref:Helicase-like protein n=1 Tax=Mangrovibacterium marinum TaxID=1639118 RepID=A0A2T5BZR4_9BACT|nr:DEAD/DEAH box helicase [Mangrovibacterium marinum]PTN07782.1 helicase-like protein [Mangrovibacterium marinum]
MSQELIIGLTEHRTFGYLFQAFLIEQKRSFYTITKMVKQRDIEVLQLNNEQAELVKLVEQYSDEKLVQKFSKKKESSKFFHQMDPALFEQQISPYIDKYLVRIIRLLMRGNTRLFLKQAKYSNLYDEDLIVVQPQYTDCCFCFNRTPEGTHYSLEISYDGAPIRLFHKSITMVSNEPGAFIYQGRLYAFEKLSVKKLLPFLDKESIFIASQVEEKYYKSFVHNCLLEYPVRAQGFTIIDGDVDQQVSLSLEPNLQMDAVLIPRFRYGQNEYLANNKTELVIDFSVQANQYQFTKINRDRSWEETQLAYLSKLGLREENGSFVPLKAQLLSGQDRLYEIINWLNRHKQELQESGFTFTQNRLDKVYSTEHQELELEVKEGEDWFDIYAYVQFGEFRIPFIKLKRHILGGIREFELPNGEHAILPKEWFSDYADLLPFTKQEGNNLRLKKHHFQLLQQKLKGLDKSFFNRLQDVATKAGKPVAVPRNLQATLRSYQHQGFSWMYNLFENQLGGCLADDMGLGKTLQTLTLLLKLKRLKSTMEIPEFEPNSDQGDLFAKPPRTETTEPAETPKIQAASLIVMPTSLLHNWHNEIQKFTPSLKVYRHFGVSRKRTGNFRTQANYYDVILTSYGTIRNDFEMLRDIEFFYVILDESQYIKNPGSKTYQTISQLKAKHRLVLTGTPIENSLSDLWAQMNFVNKGLLGNLAFFKREFITPIEKKSDPEKQQKLQTLIRPFILRRTKEQVAGDLPPVTEQIRYCAMASEQKRIYELEKSAIRNSILENIDQEGVEKSAFVVLQGLTKLRQLANHPSMLQGADETESGKFEQILDTLESLLAEKHKVLIFSSFVKHLELVKQQLENRKWKYSLLTGQTANRADVIQSFQDDPENRVFLISLKAGGVGLNLTSADYVFIIDPWWNPAAEMQAIARAHRIGQNKKVIVYRFITEGSIEEKILALQDRKSSLAEKFINSNNPFKAISREEIINLFS